ncbi:MAG: serine kinase [Candidatus Latescibacter sp.]|nr:serine kinase [Candidatus Latescibacter sp.]
MNLKEIVDSLHLEVKSGDDRLDTAITGGYVSDLLSDVLAHSREGNIWITLQIHQNIVAVAGTKELSGIILINGRVPEEDTLRKAEEEHIPIMVSSMPAFEVVGRLYALGISSTQTDGEKI